MENGFYPRGNEINQESKEVQKYVRERKRLTVENEVLYRTAFQDGEAVKQLILPVDYRDIAFKGIHSDIGHPGKDKSLWLAKRRFYWPGMESDINIKIEWCDRCIRKKTPVRPATELEPITTTRSIELVCVDFLSLEKSKGWFENILVITDHFTRYAQAIPCKNQSA